MTTFSQIILACPHCGIRMGAYELMSYTIHSSTVYSDGMTVTEPWLNNDKAIAICPACKKPLWLEDALLDTEEISIDNLPLAGDVYELPFALSETFKKELIQFYVDLLKDGFANTTDRKIYLRLRIWWGINDFVRYQESVWKLLPQFTSLKRARNLLANRRNSRLVFAEFKPLFRENLEKMIAIFKPEHEGEQIILAEMYRELGEMGKAKKALEGVEIKMSKKISKSIAGNKKRVMKL